MSPRRWSSGDADSTRRGEAIARLLQRARPTRVGRVLDVGCGEGGVTGVLADQAELAIGTDLALRLLRRGGHLGDARRSKVRFVAADARQLPFRDDSFDLVLLYDVLEHVDAWQVVVREAARVLCHGGCAFVTAANSRSPITVFDDPHWRLPLVAVLPPRAAEWLVAVSKRSLPDMDGAFPRFPSWRDLNGAFERAGLRVELLSNLEKFIDPESVISPQRRAFAHSAAGRAIGVWLESSAGRGFLGIYDRALARSWTFFLTKD